MRKWWLVLSLWAAAALANAECRSIHFGMVDWSDLRSTTAVASELLNELGYRPRQTELDENDIYARLASGELDAFMGLWLPSSQEQVDSYLSRGQITLLAKNIPQARYAMAVPDYVYEAGVRSIADIGSHRDKFAGRVHALEQGNSANVYLKGLVSGNQHRLGGFDVIELPERLMLRQVNRYHKDQQWVAFLAWEPHPMNQSYNVRYLSGGEDFFGKDMGLSSVHTITRSSFSSECANAAKLLSQIQLPAEQVASIMDMIINQFVPADRAARHWMFTHPHLVTEWLSGVTMADGSAVNLEQLLASMELRISN
jgi:glycine betaine/proline transport system substrate-binding protein